MPKPLNLYRKLWTLADKERQAGRSPLSEHLLARLEADFNGRRKLFSDEEYRDPAFRDVLVIQTVRFAVELGYDVTLLKDATADYSEEFMRAALVTNLPNYASAIVTTQEVTDIFSGDRRFAQSPSAMTNMHG